MQFILILLLFSTSISSSQFTKPDDTLPVEIVYFYGIDSSAISSVLLYWGTATEVNCYGFDIERVSTSLDTNGIPGGDEEWTWIGFTMGSGNSNSPKYYSYQDSALSNSGIYFYRLKQMDTDGAYNYYQDVVKLNYQLTGIEKEINYIKNFSLYQNYPNPFNPVTTITFELPEENEIRLDLFNSSGELITNIIRDRKTAGKHSIIFSAKGGYTSGGNGNYLSSGVYFYRLISGSIAITKKFVLLK